MLALPFDSEQRLIVGSGQGGVCSYGMRIMTCCTLPSAQRCLTSCYRGGMILWCCARTELALPATAPFELRTLGEGENRGNNVLTVG